MRNRRPPSHPMELRHPPGEVLALAGDPTVESLRTTTTYCYFNYKPQLLLLLLVRNCALPTATTKLRLQLRTATSIRQAWNPFRPLAPVTLTGSWRETR